MAISAKIVADSVTYSKVRLTTYVLRYHRFIHSELLTHRMFSRNASSSRAIPFKRQLKDIQFDMAMPLQWGANQKGMQAGAPLSRWRRRLGRCLWRSAGDAACLFAYFLDKLGVHKQIVNRIIEPFSYITVVLTGCDDAFANFFALRHHSMAQPEIAELARQMHEVYLQSTPKYVDAGDWHLPFIDQRTWLDTLRESDLGDKEHEWFKATLIKRSVARCARVSYMRHDGGHPTLEEDLGLYDRLLGSHPIHASPAEHQAMGSVSPVTRSGNFRGWVQFRQTLPDQYVTVFTKPLG